MRGLSSSRREREHDYRDEDPPPPPRGANMTALHSTKRAVSDMAKHYEGVASRLSHGPPNRPLEPTVSRAEARNQAHDPHLSHLAGAGRCYPRASLVPCRR